MSNGSFLIWNSACATNPGKVRSVNQDACLDLPELGLWVVADGMGGHEAGEVASGMIVEYFRQINEPENLNNFIINVQNSLLQVNRKLREMATQQYSNQTIGSTVVALLAFGNQCAYVWVGDSRIYRLRNNIFEQMTRDHSMAEEYIDQGQMTLEEIQNSNISNALTRAVGAEDDLNIDIRMDEIKDGDVFLLCSDGLYREISAEEMAQFMARPDDCTTMTNNLLGQALNRDARDNITLSLVQIKDAYS